MRALKIATVVMGVLIVLGTTGLVIILAKRGMKPAAPAPVTALTPSTMYNVRLEEPAGTAIAGVSALGDRVAVRLSGGGPDRVVVMDPATGAVTGRISLSR